MAKTAQRLEVTLDTLLESVDVAESIVRRVAEAAGFDEDNAHNLGMAVREGMINAYNYGNARDPEKKITMIIEFEPDKMVIHVMDEGSGFEPAEVPDPLAEENILRTSGRGLFLMRVFTDEFAVRRGPRGGTDLVMTKHLPSRASGDRECRSE